MILGAGEDRIIARIVQTLQDLNDADTVFGRILQALRSECANDARKMRQMQF
jgi:hypothetical protein